MRAQRSMWSVWVGLAVLASVLMVSAPAVAQQSGEIRIQGTSIGAKLAVMNRTELTGSFDTGCLSHSPAPTEGQTVAVDVASPGVVSGWGAAEPHTFILSAANGKQKLCQYLVARNDRALYVTVTEESSCDDQHTWVITFTEEQAAVVIN